WRATGSGHSTPASMATSASPSTSANSLIRWLANWASTHPAQFWPNTSPVVRSGDRFRHLFGSGGVMEQVQGSNREDIASAVMEVLESQQQEAERWKERRAKQRNRTNRQVPLGIALGLAW